MLSPSVHQIPPTPIDWGWWAILTVGQLAFIYAIFRAWLRHREWFWEETQ